MRTTLGGHTHIEDGHQVVCCNRSCTPDTVGTAKTTKDTEVSQACRVYGDHASCSGENTLGTCKCKCGCHRSAA